MGEVSGLKQVSQELHQVQDEAQVGGEGEKCCSGLIEKHPPWAYVFEHLVPSRWRCLGGYGFFRRQSLAGGS